MKTAAKVINLFATEKPTEKSSTNQQLHHDHTVISNRLFIANKEKFIRDYKISYMKLLTKNLK